MSPLIWHYRHHRFCFALSLTLDFSTFSFFCAYFFLQTLHLWLSFSCPGITGTSMVVDWKVIISALASFLNFSLLWLPIHCLHTCQQFNSCKVRLNFVQCCAFVVQNLIFGCFFFLTSCTLLYSIVSHSISNQIEIPFFFSYNFIKTYLYFWYKAPSFAHTVLNS